MPQKQNPKSLIAHSMYEKGKRLVDVAAALKVPASTVRRWKSVYGWDNKKKSSLSVRNQTDRKRTKPSGKPNVGFQTERNNERKPTLVFKANGKASVCLDDNILKSDKHNESKPNSKRDYGISHVPTEQKPKTNTQYNPNMARPGNKNAVGNRGGGAPLRNKNAVRTHEFETLFYPSDGKKIDRGLVDYYMQCLLIPYAHVHAHRSRIQKLTEQIEKFQNIQNISESISRILASLHNK